MSWVIYFFGSGAAFFWGVGFVLGALILLSLSVKKALARVAVLLAILGMMLIGLSATPLPYWYFAVAGTVSITWLVVERCCRNLRVRYRVSLRAAVLTLWIAGIAAEIPYQIVPSLEAMGRPRLYILGDSVTAGIGEAGVERWPERLRRTRLIEIVDASRPGATIHTFVRRVEQLALDDGIYLLEIGGNDVLGSTSPDEFLRDLEELFARICRSGRVVVMFELPLPPFYNEFGRIQRRLAKRYGVRLIPKRIFVRVLTVDGATLDSIHLSQEGHELMAETVWDVIRSAYGE